MSARVLVVSKRTQRERWRAEELAGLVRSGVIDPTAVEAEHAQHHRSLDAVHAALAACHVRERELHELRAEDAQAADLVVTVGGDGAVLAAHAHLVDVPLITVNSAPERSVGHYTRVRPPQVAALVQAWLAGTAREQHLPRLRMGIRTPGATQPPTPGDLVLNDGLFTNRNPAAMTRYRLEADGANEDQHSSGVWVSTAAGSTGAIASAGMASLPPEQAALLYLVREPFFGRGAFAQLRDAQQPPRGLVLTAAIPGIGCYLDGCHTYRDVPPGASACFSASPHPLRLLLPEG